MPISSLSEDTLLKVFWICAEDDWKGDRPIIYLDSDWDWTKITHVSNYWRRLAISSPFLWRKPALTRHSRERLEMFLERSQNTPLTINALQGFECTSYNPAIGRCQKCTDNAIAALQHLSHIQSLYICPITDTVIRALLHKPAPVLQDLQLLCGTYEIVGGVLPISIANSLFGSHTPALKKLVLEGFALPYDSQIFRGLEELTVRNSKQESRYHVVKVRYPFLNDLFDILDNSPSLKQLSLFTIRNPTNIAEYHGESDSKQIEMPNLISFNIGSLSTRLCQTFLQRVKFPVHTNINLAINYTGVTQFPAILSILKTIGDQRRCNSLIITLSGSHLAGFVRKNSDTASNDKALYGRPSLSMYQVDEENRQLPDEQINHGEILSMLTKLVCDSIWKDTIELQLFVNTQYALDSNQWMMFFDSFTSLESLNVMEMDASLVDLMLPGANVSAEFLETSAQLMISMLSAFELQSAHFTEGHSDSEDPQTPLVLPRLKKISFFVYSTSKVSDQILHCMKIRSERGFAIDELFIVDTQRMHPGYVPIDFDSDWHKEIRRYVERVRF